MNMLAMVKDTLSIPLDRLSGSKTQLMTDLAKLVEDNGSALLMVIQYLCWPYIPFFIGKPSDEDLEMYPAVHLTGPHEWDPSL